MTTANKITIFRILLVPFFIVQFLYYGQTGEETYRLLALVAFALAAISDGVDGYIARRYHQRSELGAFLDPLADKLLLISAVILLSMDYRPHLEQLPIWLVATILSRDLLLLLGLVLIQFFSGKVSVRTHFVGKIATVLQMITVLWALLKWPPSWLFGWALGAAVCTGVSAIIYIVAGIRQLSASPASSPAPETDRVPRL